MILCSDLLHGYPWRLEENVNFPSLLYGQSSGRKELIITLIRYCYTIITCNQILYKLE